MGPDGKFISFFGKTADENEVFTKVVQHINETHSQSGELTFGEYFKNLVGMNPAKPTQ